MRPGEIIAGRFELERLAGRGGMGTVYRARDRERQDASVAIKVLRAGRARRPGRDERFLREMRALCELTHPSIVRYLAHGITLEGELYLAMEWIEGDTLRSRLRRHPLNVSESLRLAAQAASALGAAHRRGILHRDIKPANLMLVGGEVDALKIVDFGLACIGPLEHQAERLTGQGAILGTPGYMAPEQARGSGAVGPPVDVFALGCVLFECLTGCPPFAHDRVDQVLRAEAPPLAALCPEVPAPLAALVTAMLAKDPGHRPADGTAVMEELTASCGSLLAPHRIAAAVETARRPALTGREQRYVSVIAIRIDPARTLDPTALAAAASTLLKGETTWEDERPEIWPLPETAPGDAAAEHDDALPPAAAPDRLLGRQLQSIALAHGARIEPLGEGIFVALMLGHGVATDQVARAARCALALRRVHPDAQLALATVLSVLSVLSGPSGPSGLSGALTTPDHHLPLGDVLDRALALLGLPARPPPGPEPIRLDPIAAGLLGGGFEVTEDPAGTWLRGERKSDQTRTLLGQHTLCVGRDRELRMLLGLYEECVSESVARAVLLTAPAGVGKSRLRHEFLQQLRLQDGSERPLVLIARGDPMHSGSPLILLRQILRQAANLDDLPDGERYQHLSSWLARQLAPADLERTEEFLGDLAGAPPPVPGTLLTTARRDPALFGEQLRRAFLTWLRAECATEPLVLVLEDLHWGDLPSIKLVDAALGALNDRPLFVMGLGRPEVHDLFPALWADRPLQEIRLGPLTRKASEHLVRQVLGTVDRATIAAIVERAAGHAFYLEELIRAVAEGRSGALPETVLAMIQARLDTLGSEERRLLRAASIFGERFTSHDLCALLGSEAHSAEVELRLAELVERELLACDLHSGGRTCMFRHSLLREAAYAALTPEDRALGHLLAAQALERASEQDALLVAQHFELGGRPERAVPWHLQAAQQAIAANDFRAAIERAERGVRCGATGETLGALHLIAGRSHMSFDEVDQAEACCRLALERLPRGSHRWYEAASVTIASQLLHGIVPAIILEMVHFEPEGPITPDEGEMTAWSLLVLWALGLVDELQRFLARLERRAHLFAPGDPAAAWLDFARAIRSHMIDDDAWSALQHLAAAGAAFQRVEDLRSLALIQWVMTYVLYGLQDAEACERVARQGLATAERLSLHFVKGAIKVNLGWALAAQGDIAAGAAQLRETLTQDISPSNHWGAGGAHAQLAEVLVRAGQLDEAEREAHKALDLAMVPGSQVRAWIILGEVQLRTGRAQDALSTAHKAQALLGHVCLPGYLCWKGDLLFARALAACDNPEPAARALARVRERLCAQAAKFQDPAARQRFLLHHRPAFEQTEPKLDPTPQLDPSSNPR